MIQSKNTENIYGYTGKKKPNFNFVGGNIQGIYKKPEIKKNISQITLKDKPKELIIKSLILKNEIEDMECEKFQFNKIYENPSDFLNQSFYLIYKEQNIEFVLLQHEKGISIKINNFDIFPKIDIDGEHQSITFKLQDHSLKIAESKFTFKNLNFPFHYIYEINQECDGIFNDFILSNLPEIRPPTNVTVPSKHTNNVISYRQYISYIKTNSFLNFKVNQSGWYVDNFSYEEDEKDLPNGVNIIPNFYWIYHPRCQRIEHLIQFP
jgi:hypothetical protein